MELKRNDLDHLHDVVYDCTGLDESDDKLIERFNLLPENLKNTAYQWGFNDTVFRDELILHLEKTIVTNNEGSKTKKHAT
jgi:hypothetical protein